MQKVENLVLLLLLALPLVGIFLTENNPPVRSLSTAKAQVTCRSGTCYLLMQESNYILRLQNLLSYPAHVGDRVITLGEGTEAEIIFPDDSRLILRDTSLTSVQKGRGSVIRDLNKNTEDFQASPLEEEGDIPVKKIVYVGEIPLEVLRPIPGSEIISLNDEASIKVVVKKSKIKDESKGDFQSWEIFKEDNSVDPPRFNVVNTFKLNPTKIDNIYEANLQIRSKGELIFVPQGYSPAMAYNGFRITLKDRSALADSIGDLLDNYDERKAKPLEIKTE